eukprot:CAMPEP_0195510616 /NCGR_PEP_ID=MMETSP0794_2-20130614/3210_1 /TAXON_ID=515487 /ORGANISM="Stephanopyxis turris, Strain CCMP 815" /LENGTH=205 /DNA_ID=CAMNT_0040638069 /DNA_START=124 /DNA_END=738 /DNA_ORIENTATION=-
MEKEEEANNNEEVKADAKSSTTNSTITDNTDTSAKSNTKIIYLIRHAESEENANLAGLKNVCNAISRFHLPSKDDTNKMTQLIGGVLKGYNDEPLSDYGRSQSKAMGELLSMEKFLETEQVELVVHSPLVRARDTCKAMLGCSGIQDVSNSDGKNSEKKNDDSIELPNPVGEVLQLQCLREATVWEQLTKKKKGIEPRLNEFEDW